MSIGLSANPLIKSKPICAMKAAEQSRDNGALESMRIGLQLSITTKEKKHEDAR